MKFVVLELVWNVVDCLKTHQVDHIKQILLKLIYSFCLYQFPKFQITQVTSLSHIPLHFLFDDLFLKKFWEMLGQKLK